MKFSINPVAVYKMISEQRNSSKIQVSEYLELIAKDARDLADIWRRIGEDVAKNGSANIHNSNAFNDFYCTFGPLNGAPYNRLCHFYDQISLVTHRKVDAHLRKSFISHLSSLIVQREVTIETYLNMIKNGQHTLFIGKSNSLCDFKDFGNLIQGLNKEASALEVLAKTIRII